MSVECTNNSLITYVAVLPLLVKKKKKLLNVLMLHPIKWRKIPGEKCNQE